MDNSVLSVYTVTCNVAIAVKRLMPCFAPFLLSEGVHVQRFAVLRVSLRRFWSKVLELGTCLMLLFLDAQGEDGTVFDECLWNWALWTLCCFIAFFVGVAVAVGLTRTRGS